MAVCDSMSVTEPTIDESELVIEGFRLEQGSQWNVLVANVVVNNSILSGNGEDLAGTVEITRGQDQIVVPTSANLPVTIDVEVNAGDTVERSVEVQVESGGNYQICADWV
jgi:hypothetical protein